MTGLTGGIPQFLLLSLYFNILITILAITTDNQASDIYDSLYSKRSRDLSLEGSWASIPVLIKGFGVRVAPQNGLMEADRISSLPGQPAGVEFDQYAGYVNVDPVANKELFYYFAESPHNSTSKPLVLWLTGGPGCSSFGNGALQELGPFRVKNDGKSLYRNNYSWNKVANVIFLDSPAGVGFSLESKSIDTQPGDKSTARDTYNFLITWLERFPHYKTRDLYLTGESYAGHYLPQLAETIMNNNKIANHTVINLKGIAMGNPMIDAATNLRGLYDYLWMHGMYSDDTHSRIQESCNFSELFTSAECNYYTKKVWTEIGPIRMFNIYSTPCLEITSHDATESVENYDTCSYYYVKVYLNTKEVQNALHVKPTQWSSCRIFAWQDSPSTSLPVIQYLISNKISVWIYSGDLDARVPLTSSKYSIDSLQLPVRTSWRPWYTNHQVGGYVVAYEGLVFATVEGQGTKFLVTNPKES